MLGGLVEIPLLLSYADLRQLPSTQLDSVIACIGNPPGGHCLGQARWQGVAMHHILAEVVLKRDARYAHLFAADGYSTSIKLERLNSASLVYGMNDGPLPPEHGYPARLVVPGLYGYKMPKWIQRIVLADTPLAGTWEQRGWGTSGRVQTTSHILYPHHQAEISGAITLRGMAYGGDHAIVKVEVSVNGGPWMPAPFTQPTPTGQAEWAVEWTPHAPGEHRITVRATDDSGFVQPDTAFTNSFPNGSSALHSIVVRA